jgi:hypothetical protein
LIYLYLEELRFGVLGKEGRFVKAKHIAFEGEQRVNLIFFLWGGDPQVGDKEQVTDT